MSQEGYQKLGNGIETEEFIFASEEKYSTLVNVSSQSGFPQCVY